MNTSSGRDPKLGELDLHLFGQGRHHDLADQLGAHPSDNGTHFAVWAPGAAAVHVVGDGIGWDPPGRALTPLGSSGVWNAEVAGIGSGDHYRFRITTATGQVLEKADPMAQATDLPPGTASRIHLSNHTWSDDDWMASRGRTDTLAGPLSIYEVHLGSWRRDPARPHQELSYSDLADSLVAYVRDMGFTHVEFMPVMGHPFAGSWGYQVTSYYAPSPRWGSPDQFAELIDRFHRANIGVILDWVPAHFHRDAWSLGQFDGTALYEHFDPKRGAHPDWGTLEFNLGRHEVRNFLIANAVYWLDRFHADGLRVDAVASMLYLDYSREAGSWDPNPLGGREDLDAVAFLRELNTVLQDRFKGVLVIAEESTAWPGVSRPVERGGLGFDAKWNLGWMHDTLAYFSEDPVHRRFHHDSLTLPLSYAFTENFVLPLSHDEVVHGKGSLLRKMPGDRWQQFANLRSLLALMWAHPGKQLLFMGGEFAQDREWSHDRSLDWHLLDDPQHTGVQALVRALNLTYRKHAALWAEDFSEAGFAWLEMNDSDHNVVAFLRRDPTSGQSVACIANLSPVPRHGYRVGLPPAGEWEVLLDTDAASFGGSDAFSRRPPIVPQAIPWHGQDHSTVVELSPLAVLWLAPAG